MGFRGFFFNIISKYTVFIHEILFLLHDILHEIPVYYMRYRFITRDSLFTTRDISLLLAVFLPDKQNLFVSFFLFAGNTKYFVFFSRLVGEDSANPTLRKGSQGLDRTTTQRVHSPCTTLPSRSQLHNLLPVYQVTFSCMDVAWLVLACTE